MVRNLQRLLMVHLRESLDRQKNNGDHAVRKLRLNKPHPWVQISRPQEEALRQVDPLLVGQELHQEHQEEEQEVHQLQEEHQQQEAEEHRHLEVEDPHHRYPL